MDIEKIAISDLDEVVELVGRVSREKILPCLSEEGQVNFTGKILPGIKTTFEASNFNSVKVIDNNKIIGFGAIRDGNYITHIFVDSDYQGKGVGRALLKHLLQFKSVDEVSLKASVNAVGFYESEGFITTGEETDVDGIRFVPMSLSLNLKTV